jgi:membrane-associated phospholipid phosphatase
MQAMRTGLVVIFGLTVLGLAQNAHAATSSTTKTYGNPTLTTIGDGTAIALPLLAGAVAVYKDDWKGVAQLTVEGILTVGTAYALKNIVRERRPDGSDYQSFPSGTTALAASGSSFLWGRYGWEYGLPAFVATQFVSYTRIQAKEHHWYDTLASSAIAAGYGFVVTTPFKKKYNIDTELAPSPDGAVVRFSYNF